MSHQMIHRPTRTAPRRFAADEGGSLIVFALFLFVLMIMMGGIAVDVMKYEQRRTTLQNTLDRCTLSAASMTQDLEPEFVVEDCVQKVGLAQYITAITVTEGLNFRSVQAEASVDTSPFFLHMIGVDAFDAPGSSTAEQRINNVEIALVLDVSGSMGGAKIANLKTAAKEFVSTVLANDAENRISIAIVPYNAQVNLGAPLRSKFNATYQHGVADVNCLEVPTSAYATSTMPRTLNQPMSAYADVVGGTSQSTSYISATGSNGVASSFHCPASSANVVRLPARDIATLQNQIDNLVAAGNTSIMLGMKWGMTLLDPGSRPVLSELVTEGLIPANFGGRPFDYADEDAIKVIVLMTDGEHVSHNKVNNAYKGGIVNGVTEPLSPIWKSPDGYYSIRHTAGRPAAALTNEYWVPHLCTANSCRDGTDTTQGWRSTPWTGGVQQSWPQVWGSVRQTWVAWQLYARALGTASTRVSTADTAMANFRSQFASVNTMNTQLQQSCTLAKDNNVIVYGIAFEAPANGQTQISTCASSPAHYFNAQGLQIQSAFRAIAANISQLRLTQ